MTARLLLLCAACALCASTAQAAEVADLHGMRCCCPCEVYTLAASGDTLRAVRYTNQGDFLAKRNGTVLWDRTAARFHAITDLRATEAPAATAAVTLYWTMPLNDANGRPLSTAPLDWQAAYSTQSRTWVAHRWPIITDPDSAAFWWPTVVSEAAPLVVMSGTAVPGWHMAITPVPVTASDWPFSWWIRTRQRPAGQWSLWSNPVTRADNQ